MRKLTSTICVLGLATVIVFALKAQTQEQVEIEMMTYPEIYSAIHNQGKTTVLIYNGGTVQRGPHAVLGGHTFMARAIAPMIARKLGNALVAPVLPFSINPAGGVDPKMPGSVALAPELFQKVNEAVVDSMVKNGFKNIVLMGDHGGGQDELNKLAEILDAKYRSQGVEVYFCGDVYEKSWHSATMAGFRIRRQCCICSRAPSSGCAASTERLSAIRSFLQVSDPIRRCLV